MLSGADRAWHWVDAPRLEAALRKAGGDSAAKSEEQKAMVGPGSPAFLPSPQCKVEAGGGDAKGQLGSVWGPARVREQLKIKAPSPRSWIKESRLPPCPPYNAASGDVPTPSPSCLHSQWGWSSTSPRLCPRAAASGLRGATLPQMLGLRVKPGHSKTPSNSARGENDTPQPRLNPGEMGELSTP